MGSWATAVAALGLSLAGSATAEVVTVEGSFGSFSGPVAYPPESPNWTGFGPSLVNDIQINPNAPSSRPGVGIGSLTLAPGTTSVEFYNVGENHNLLMFTPAPAQNAAQGQEILIGTFTLRNGSWFGGLGEGDGLFSFTAITSSADPTLSGHTFSDSIRYRITQSAAGNTPEQNADYFWFDGRPDLGSMSVYEQFDSPIGSNIGSINLYGRIGSLIPTRLGDAQGGVFVGAVVPEPSTYALVVGVGLVVFALRRRAR